MMARHVKVVEGLALLDAEELCLATTVMIFYVKPALGFPQMNAQYVLIMQVAREQAVIVMQAGSLLL
ncbi:unnamed protein product [Blepharisma stoltei]|uniref:Uncharacterized protein n=1 Tax=Blepharisma stoltei TaxID=1481888 RepID=A0AAU9KGJ5_9CILI|nr:unnamed protein product [Blepharisma stoltei]